MPWGSISSAAGLLGRAGPFRRPGPAGPRCPPATPEARGGSGRPDRRPATRAPKPCAALASSRDRADHAVGPPQARHRDGGTRQDRRCGQFLTGIRRLQDEPKNRRHCRQRLRQRRIAVRREPIRAGEQYVEREHGGMTGGRGRDDLRQARCAATAMGRSGPVPRGRYRRSTMPGPPAAGRGSSGNSRSSARSRSASHALPGDSAHAASSTARRTSPTSPGRSWCLSVASGGSPFQQTLALRGSDDQVACRIACHT